jgi:hypothetical protein
MHEFGHLPSSTCPTAQRTKPTTTMLPRPRAALRLLQRHLAHDRRDGRHGLPQAADGRCAGGDQAVPRRHHAWPASDGGAGQGMRRGGAWAGPRRHPRRSSAGAGERVRDHRSRGSALGFGRRCSSTPPRASATGSSHAHQQCLGAEHGRAARSGDDPEDEFTDKVEDRYRVLDLGDDGKTYRQRVFKIEKEKDVLLGSETLPADERQAADFIPFAICGASGKSDCDRRAAADRSRGQERRALPGQRRLSARAALHRTADAVPAGYHADEEATSSTSARSRRGCSPIRTRRSASRISGAGPAIARIRSRLASKRRWRCSARMIADETKQGVETLGRDADQAAGREQHPCRRSCRACREALEWALGVFAQWAGADGRGHVSAQPRLHAGDDGRPRIAGAVSAVQAGALSEPEFFDLMQRGDVIDGEKSYELHQEEIASDGPTAPLAPAPAKGAAAA